jgi:hypothetical protein
MRGQLGFILVLGLVFVAVIVILLAFQQVAVPPPTTVPTAIASEYAVVKDSFEGLVRRGTDTTIRDMEQHGGRITQGMRRATENFSYVPFVVFNREGVAFWWMCNETVYQDLEQATRQIERGIENYIRANMEAVSLGPRASVDLDSLSVNAFVYDERVDVVISLPTTIGNYTVTEPYRVSLSTKFGRIYKFAMDYSDQAAEDRFWEFFTIADIYLSTKLMAGRDSLFECGDALIMTPQQTSKDLEDIISVTLVSVDMWEPIRAYDEVGGAKAWGVEHVNGRQYPDLDMDFWLPDDFELQITEPLVVVNSEPVATSDYYHVPVCITPIVVHYSFAYPVVTRVNDDLLGEDFVFAGHVNIDDMLPGRCEAKDYETRCGDLECIVSFSTLDAYGNPLQGVTATFGGCMLGTTGPDGVIESNARYDENELVIFKEGYGVVKETVPAMGIDYQYTLHRITDLNVEFYQLSTDCSVNKVDHDSALVFLRSDTSFNYTLLNTNPDFNMVECLAYSEICAIAQDESLRTDDLVRLCAEGTAKCMNQSLLDTVNVNYIPGGSYTASAMVTNPRIMGELGTQKQYTYVMMPIQTKTDEITMPEEDGTLHVFVPDSDAIYSDAMQKYTQRYDHHHGCHGGVGGDCYGGWYCDHDCAWGLATADVIEYINQTGQLFTALVEGCGKDIVEAF